MSRQSLVQASDSTSRQRVGRRRSTPAERTGRSLRKRRPFLPWHPVWHRATEAPRMVLPLHRGTRRLPRPPHRRTDPSPGRWRAAPPRAVPPSSTRSSTARHDGSGERTFGRIGIGQYHGIIRCGGDIIGRGRSRPEQIRRRGRRLLLWSGWRGSHDVGDGSRDSTDVLCHVVGVLGCSVGGVGEGGGGL